MASAINQPEKPAGLTVTADTLVVAPDVLGQRLADPWRRLLAMILDILIVALLSLLATPFLALVTGFLLVVLLGGRSDVPMILKAFRWVLRGVGLLVIALSVLALGHITAVQSRELNLEALTGRVESTAMKETVHLPPNPTMGELRTANTRLQNQVAELKKEYREQHAAGASWLHQARAFTGALGVTFGWSGIYFTLVTGLLRGRSLGKLLLGIRVVKVNGTQLTYFDTFIRHGGYVAGVAMGMIGFLKILWEPNRQGVEDRIAGTVVIKG